MRIAQVSPLFESVPPQKYGGTERVVSYLTEELVRQGHTVTLFASADSVTSAELAPACPQALRLAPRCDCPMAHHVLQLEEVIRRAADFDIVHFHIDLLHLSHARRLGRPHLTTLHGRLDLPELFEVYRQFHDVPVVSISNAQRRPVPHAMWAGTVYHGLPPALLPFNPDGGDYFAFLGRICPEKRVDRAIEIAARAGVPLKVAAKVDPADRAYFADIRHLFDDPNVELIGEIDDRAKPAFLGNARATLFPIDWPEPFGLVMIESLSCGTPVVAYRRGSVPEIVDHGVTGYIVDDLDEAVAAALRVDEIDRRRCRAVFEARYSVERMVGDYLRLYRAATSAPMLRARADAEDREDGRVDLREAAS